MMEPHWTTCQTGRNLLQKFSEAMQQVTADLQRSLSGPEHVFLPTYLSNITTPFTYDLIPIFKLLIVAASSIYLPR